MMAGRSLPQLRSGVGVDVLSSLEDSARLGFLGGMPMDEQIDHALGFAVTTEQALGRIPSSVADLGTGGGLPGLVLHSCWPECQLALIDGNRRRTEFLGEVVEGWGSSALIEVVRGRAEELARNDLYRSRFEVVTARSFGPPAVTAECGAPLLVTGGILVVSEPPDGPAEGRWSTAGLAQLGLSLGFRTRLDGRFGYQVLIKSASTPDRYPRRVGIPSKRPLF